MRKCPHKRLVLDASELYNYLSSVSVSLGNNPAYNSLLYKDLVFISLLRAQRVETGYLQYQLTGFDALSAMNINIAQSVADRLARELLIAVTMFNNSFAIPLGWDGNQLVFALTNDLTFPTIVQNLSIGAYLHNEVISVEQSLLAYHSELVAKHQPQFPFTTKRVTVINVVDSLLAVGGM